MADSSLVNYEHYTPKYSYSQYKKTKITPHHAAGVWANAKQGVEFFYNVARSASANYIIANNGEIGQCVKEKDRAWTSSSTWNDCRAITIEVSNSKVGEPWQISDAAYDSLVKLCVDICKRNDIETVNYTGDKYGVLTEHRMFAATACPGTTLHNYINTGRLAQDINAKLKANVPEVQPSEKGPYIYEGLNYSDVFNPVYYSSRYPDLAAAGLNSKKQLFAHFILRGMVFEARKGCDTFDPQVYREANPDLNAAFDDDWSAYYKHYLMFGKKEIADGLRVNKTV